MAIPDVKTDPRLTRFERLAVGIGAFLNERPGPKALQSLFHRHFGMRWVGYCTGNLLHVEGLDIVRRLAPPRGVLMCANHRSFFDQYAISCLVAREAHETWARNISFPVRSGFFYESWAGVAVNLVIAGGAMYPPIFRDPARADLNKRSLERVAELLQAPGTVVGLHPEGTRGKGPDPYQLLPAQPGVGMVALRSRATILPVWVNGLGNDFLAQIASNFRTGERRGQPIIVVIGEPVDLGPLAEGNPRPALYKRVADRILDEIRRLGERERAIRASLR